MSPGDRTDIERFAIGGWIDPPMSQVSGRLVLLGDVVGTTLLYVGHIRLDTARNAGSSLWTGMDDLEVSECPFGTRPQVESARWCRPGVAISVRFDGRNAIGRLRMPSLYQEDAARAPRRAHRPAQPRDDRTPLRA
ncbi:hypothetical protein [Solicola sp. PLA-1-18]|uniref:hypothetical protein n=1 Tax=Solicola sp. PLA-1-18 TaxID=3380532 RepID=UPI003B7AF424